MGSSFLSIHLLQDWVQHFPQDKSRIDREIIPVVGESYGFPCFLN
jgi:hypothetical protein